MKKAAWTLIALLATCAAATGCVAQVTDDIGTESSELTEVEPDEIDCASAYYVGSANGGVWKTTNGASRADDADAGEVDSDGRDDADSDETDDVTPVGSGGTSSRGEVEYGPVITIKPKG